MSIAANMTKSAFIRSTIALMRRSNSAHIRTFAARADREFYSLLVLRNLTCPPKTFERLGIVYGMTLDERKKRLDVSPHTPSGHPLEKRLQNSMKDGADANRVMMWTRRIGMEMEALVANAEPKWYPFFCTLTVDQRAFNAKEILQAKSHDSELYRFIRRLEKRAGSAAGVYSHGKWTCSPSSVFRYSGVIEHGESSHHHHAHYMLLFREIPWEWKLDPCASHYRPGMKSRCGYIEAQWPFGLAECVYWRFVGDPWTLLGFRMPDALRGKPLLDAYRSGAYLAKYLKKEEREWNHRMRATRGFGSDVEMMVCRGLSSPMLITLLTIPSWPKRLKATQISSLDMTLLKRNAKSELFRRRWVSTSNRLALKEIEPSCSPYSAMVQSVKDGHLPWKMSSEERTNWLRSEIKLAAGPRCEALWARLADRLVEIDSRKLFFGTTPTPTLGR